MPRPDPAQTDPEASWPSCDDQQPGVSIRPLSRADLAALLAHLDHDQNHDRTPGLAGMRPVVAVRVRATVGRPGASAAAEYQRRQAAERAGWTRTLPWRVTAVVTAGLAVGLLAAQAIPDRGSLAGVVVSVGLAWAFWFRVS